MKTLSVCALVFFLLLAGCTNFPLSVPTSTATQNSVTQTATTMPTGTATFTPEPTNTATSSSIPLPPNPMAHFSAGAQVDIRRIQMFSTTAGWAEAQLGSSGDYHILHTSDGGNTWKDVTPPESGQSNSFKTALEYFEDASSAWVLYDFDIANASAGAPILWHTTDAGTNWTAASTISIMDMMEFFDPGFFSFVDQTHGWLLVHVGAGMMHDWVYLFATNDGGLTWSSLFDPTNSTLWQSCSKTGMAFNTATSGIITGDCQGVAAGVYLFQTNDGGVNWSEVTLPDPAQAPGIFTDQNQACGSYNPAFLDNMHGFLQVDCKNFNTSVSQSYLYKTSDGGVSWSPSPLPAPGGSYQFLDTQNGFYVSGKVYVTNNGGASWQAVATVNWSGQPDFIDAQNGWIVAVSGDQSALVHSTNGGASWSIIHPVIAP
jgi:photosystem II stability/assembly factor-like uncharacterized protein